MRGHPVSFSDPGISELFGDAGCDFTWFDMEHYPIDLPAARGHFMAVRGTLAASLNRVLPATPMCSSRCWSCTRPGWWCPMSAPSGKNMAGADLDQTCLRFRAGNKGASGTEVFGRSAVMKLPSAV